MPKLSKALRVMTLHDLDGGNSKYTINYRSRQGKYKGLWDLVNSHIEGVKSVRKKQGPHSCSHLFPLLPYEEAQRKASHSSMRGALLTLKMVRGSNLGYLTLRTVRSLARKPFQEGLPNSWNPRQHYMLRLRETRSLCMNLNWPEETMEMGKQLRCSEIVIEERVGITGKIGHGPNCFLPFPTQSNALFLFYLICQWSTTENLPGSQRLQCSRVGCKFNFQRPCFCHPQSPLNPLVASQFNSVNIC